MTKAQEQQRKRNRIATVKFKKKLNNGQIIHADVEDSAEWGLAYILVSNVIAKTLMECGWTICGIAVKGQKHGH